MTNAISLVNLTGEPVFVRADRKLLRLPEAPAPRALEMSARTAPRDLDIRIGEVETAVQDIDVVCSLMSGPPVLDGVMWLVSADAFAEFPHRSDFVRPALWKLENIEELEIRASDAQTIEDESLIPGSLMVLSAVTRSARVAAPDAANIADLDPM